MTLTHMIKGLFAKPKKEWRWYHGAAFLVGAQVAAFTLEGLVAWAAGNRPRFELFSNDQVKLYYELKQAKFIPPPWVFGPAWITNNILTIAGTLLVLNNNEQTPGRNAFLKLQAASWLVFVSFNAGSVGLRSPINAFSLTFAMWVFTVASTIIALRQLKDNRVAWLLSTLLLWTTIASAVALCQMLWNYDELYNLGPFTQPVPGLVRT